MTNSLKILLACLLLWSFGFNQVQATSLELKVGTKRIQVQLAKTKKEQRQGLSGVKKLSWNQGMLFVYSGLGERVFWMRGMKIPIDMLWLRQGVIVHIRTHVSPPPMMTRQASLKRYGQGLLADQVLEVKAGFCERFSIQKGDKVLAVATDRSVRYVD